MKKSLILILLVAVFFGCNNSEEKKIIPDYDKLYPSPEKVDVPPALSDNTGRILDDNIIDTIRKVFKNKSIEAVFDFELVLLINEDGSIDGTQFKEKTVSSDTEISRNPFFDEVKIEIAHALENLKFTPAIKDGKNTKSKFNWLVAMNVDKEGNVARSMPEEGIPSLPPPRDFSSGEYFTVVDEMPSVIGGIEAVKKQIKYPEDARKAGIKGKVFVKVFVDEKGEIVSSEILKGTGSSLDTAALNAVRRVKFTPGMQKGKPLKTQVVIPVVFELN